MQDITGIMWRKQRIAVPKPKVSRLSVGAGLRTLVVLIGNAHSMAYVDPYAAPRRQQQILPPENPDGRDSTW